MLHITRLNSFIFFSILFNISRWSWKTKYIIELETNVFWKETTGALYLKSNIKNKRNWSEQWIKAGPSKLSIMNCGKNLNDLNVWFLFNIIDNCWKLLFSKSVNIKLLDNDFHKIIPIIAFQLFISESN